MPARSFPEVRRILAEHRADLEQRFGIKSIGVFGSWVRDEQTAASDVDILVEFREAVGFFRFLESEEYLADLLGVKVDLVTRGALKPHIGRQILQEVVMI